jgi:hypothetical protein
VRSSGGSAVRQEKRAVEVLAELATQDPEAAGAVAEPGGRLVGREFIDVEGAQGFVLALDGTGREEEGSLLLR